MSHAATHSLCEIQEAVKALGVSVTPNPCHLKCSEFSRRMASISLAVPGITLNIYQEHFQSHNSIPSGEKWESGEELLGSHIFWENF